MPTFYVGFSDNQHRKSYHIYNSVTVSLIMLGGL